MTNTKAKILSLIQESASPVDVYTLCSKVAVNKTTIYRNIDSLIESGDIVEVDLLDGKKRYESSALSHHHHLVCEKCKKIQDVDFYEESILTQIEASTGFLLLKHNTEFFGLCASCK